MKESTGATPISFERIFGRRHPASSFLLVLLLSLASKQVADARVAGHHLFAASSDGKVVSLASDSSNPIGDINLVSGWTKQDTLVVIFAVFGVTAMVGILTASIRFCCGLRNNSDRTDASDTGPKSASGVTDTVKAGDEVFDDEHELS